MAFNKKTHLRQNIDALKTAFTLDRERRRRLPEEEKDTRRIQRLRRHQGSAGKPHRETGQGRHGNARGRVAEVIRANTPDEREYKRYMDGIKNSVLTAFYTPPKVADAIVEAIWDTRIVPKRILDPSAGTGFSSMPWISTTLRGDHLLRERPRHGVDPEAPASRKRVRVQGFERIEPKYAGYYDVAVSNILSGTWRSSTRSSPPIPTRAAARHTGAAQLFLYEVGRSGARGGLVAFITSQGVLNAEQGRPVREWLMNRCEPVSAIRLPNNLFTDHAGTEVGSDLVIPAKESRHGGTVRTAAGFHRIPQAVERHPDKQPFPVVRQSDPYRGQSRQRPLRQTGDGVHPRGGRGRHRPGDAAYALGGFQPAFQRELLPGTCRNKHPVHRSGNCPVPVRRNASVPKDTSPALPERSSRRLSPTPVTFSSSGKRRKNAASSPEMAAQGYHVDTETDKCYRILPPPRRRTDRKDLADFGAWSGVACGSSAAETRRFRHGYPRAARGRNNGTETQGGRRVAFRHGGNGCHPPAAEPVQQEPLLTLYDLFGFSAEERRQAELGISKKRNSRRGAKRKTPRQPSLFAPASSPEEQKSEMPKTTPPERDPEDLYASLNWEDNPPINGFYEMMMSLTPERRAELRRQNARQQETSGTAGTAGGTPPTEAPERQTETSRRYAENGQPVRHAGQSGGGRTR